ncbi:neuronal acetylcholine receptor subunit alpha-9-like [Dreissena polymorpha]|uniref:neuronal acetylcholine receptor subunit alpha-9-like n=1 Tax=Dreissena polymorpha TaxID=45954 RepID=UPI002263CBDC|nr:neuronal acetylcholine receptor subunit alpha-9-like [Dreissena polymorpha]
MKISGFLLLQWFDDFLKWEPEDYGELDHFTLPQNDVWKPDVALHNSFRAFTGLGSSNLFILEETCDVDITYFPFDTQECPFKFSAWSYSKEEVEMIMKLKRKSLFYVFYILIPMVLLLFLNALTFVLPISSGERASFAVTVFLSLDVFLTVVASEIAKNSNTISIVSVYMTAMIALSTATVMTSLLESRLASRDKDRDAIGPGYRSVYRLARICMCKRDGISNSATELEWNGTGLLLVLDNERSQANLDETYDFLSTHYDSLTSTRIEDRTKALIQNINRTI